MKVIAALRVCVLLSTSVTSPSSTGVANSGAESIVSQSPRQRLNIQSDKVEKGDTTFEVVSVLTDK